MKRSILFSLIMMLVSNVMTAQKVTTYSQEMLPKEHPGERIKSCKKQWFGISAGGGFLRGDEEDLMPIYDIYVSYRHSISNVPLFVGADLGSSQVLKGPAYEASGSDYTAPSLYIMPTFGVIVPLRRKVELDFHIGLGYEILVGEYESDVLTPYHERELSRNGLRMKASAGIWINHVGIALSYAPRMQFETYFDKGSKYREIFVPHRFLLNMSYRF